MGLWRRAVAQNGKSLAQLIFSETLRVMNAGFYEDFAVESAEF
jgi:hypothetical protein